MQSGAVKKTTGRYLDRAAGKETKRTRTAADGRGREQTATTERMDEDSNNVPKQSFRRNGSERTGRQTLRRNIQRTPSEGTKSRQLQKGLRERRKIVRRDEEGRRRKTVRLLMKLEQEEEQSQYQRSQQRNEQEVETEDVGN